MRTSDCEILILPSHGELHPDFWLARWARQLPTARIVAHDDPHAPDPDAHVAALLAEIAGAVKPVVLVGHGLGALTIARAVEADAAAMARVSGAYFVAAPDVESAGTPAPMQPFAPLPLVRLPFPSALIASRTDPHCDYARAKEFADAWGATIADAGESGHIDRDAGFGPWPEGLMRFAALLKALPSVH
ncbi:MAG TPA: alpha/beta fold hydrolase [Saliniramus sp.]|nr:alpha/beta fold hydrolase [Saliniramus sp.]